MSDAGNTPLPWYAPLDDVLRGHVAAKGWDKLDAAGAALEIAKAHRFAQTELTRLHGIPQDQVARIPPPEDAAGWADLHKRLGKPEKPDDYKVEGLKFGDGKEPDPQFVGAVKQIAFDLDLPAAKAGALAQRIMGLADADERADGEQRTARMSAADTELRRAWGGQHDYFNFQCGRAMDLLGMPREVAEFARASGPEHYIKFMDGMRGLAAKMGEAEMLRGSPNARTTPMYTPETAQARIDELKNDRSWREKMMKGDADAMREFDDLARVVVGPPSTNPTVR